MRVCSIDGCGRTFMARGFCHNHWRQWKKHGDPLRRDLSVPPYHPPGPLHPRWKGASAGYAPVHRRIQRRKGKAGNRSCFHCGERAAEWAYDHADPDELIGDNHGRECAYSTDADHYIPLCISCHRTFDKAHALRAAADVGGC